MSAPIELVQCFDARRSRSLPSTMSPHKRPSAQATSALAQRRVVAVLACLKVLCSSADPRSKRKLANEILTLVRSEDRLIPEKMITPAAVYEMITRNSQCVLNQTGRCPLLVFSQQLCEELNEFFMED
jgi:hypothetical protein